MAFLVGTSAPLSVQKLAIPAVSLLIAFLGYGSQYLFANSPDLSPGPLTPSETYTFNALLLCLWWTYYRTCTLDPGHYVFPPPKKLDQPANNNDDDAAEATQDQGEGRDTRRQRRRQCRKCARPKPPRSHHCRTCGRCVPKMDHHCPWTANCVSLQTFPHFLRFLAYANVSLWTLQWHVWARLYALWEHRHLPAYLGPTLAQLSWLTVFTFVGGGTSLALGILLATTVKGWLFNTTMIEGWEVERHEAVLERSGGGDGDGDGDASWWRGGDGEADAPLLSLEPVEFPYDLGFFANMAQAMGTANVLLWFWPFAGGPMVAANADGQQRGCGWEYEENGLNDREDMWPPADPEKVRHARVWRERKKDMDAEMESYEGDAGRWANPEEEREAFRRRQERDLRRWEGTAGSILGELEEVDGYDFVDEAYDRHTTRGPPRGIVVDEGKSGWVNTDGEQLADYGVDEEAEFDESADDEDVEEDYEDDDVPLAELLRRRKVLMKDGEDT